jgi:hypothetical protein
MTDLVTLAELKTVLGVGGLYDDNALLACTSAANNIVTSYLKATITSPETIPEIKQAALQVAMAIWSARTSPNGEQVGLDYSPSPYKLGRSLMSRVHGLISQHIDTGVYVG